jgi:PAS domain S-box-containing protein
VAPFEPQFVGTLQAIPGIISLLFLKPAYEYRHRTGSASFALFSVSVFLYSLGLVAGNFTADYQLSVWAWHLSLLGGQLLAVSWFALAARVTGKLELTRPRIGLLAAYFAGSQLLLWTNPLHEFVYVPGDLRDGIVFETAAINEGFWLLFFGGYLLIVIGTALLLLEAGQSSGLRRKQTLTLALAVLPTLAANFVSANGLGFGSHDITVFGYVFTAFFFAVALYSGRFLDITTVARRTAMAEMDDAFVTLDEQDRVVDANAAALALFDVQTDYIGMPAAAFFDVVPEAVREEFADVESTETELSVTLDGDERHLSVSVSPVGSTGETGRVFVFRDITAQKRREQRLKRKNERLDKFASVVSHDLRNPLSIATGRLKMAQAEFDSEDLDAVERSQERMATLIEDALALAREGEAVTETREVDLADVAETCWARVDTGTARLAVEADRAVQADPSRVQRLLTNLMRNAVEHGRSDADPQQETDPDDDGGDPLTVTVGDLEDGFYLQDDGTGLPEADRGRVFEAGFSTDDDGTGFGLSIVNEIVQAHDWEIRATESPDGGARFEITGVETA